MLKPVITLARRIRKRGKKIMPNRFSMVFFCFAVNPQSSLYMNSNASVRVLPAIREI